MSKAKLDALEAELKKSEAYEQKKKNAAEVVFNHFASMGAKQVTTKDVQKYADNKPFFFESQREAGQLKRANIPEEQHDKTQKGLITKFKENPLSSDELNLLKAYILYERINPLLQGNKVDDGAKSIATALQLVGDPPADKSIQLSLLLKYQYLLYRWAFSGSLQKNYPHISLSLGKYIVTQTGNHKMKKCWSLFHSGNARLMLDWEIRAKKQGNGDHAKWQKMKDNAKERQHLDAASKHYREALKIAVAEKSKYAEMLLNERLAIVERRRGQLSKSDEHYKASVKLHTNADIRPKHIVENETRHLIGRGNLKQEQAHRAKAAGDDSWMKLRDEAKQFYNTALQIANDANDNVNAQVAMNSINELDSI